MGKLIKYGLYAIALNWIVDMFLYLMGKITLNLPMRIVIDEASLQFIPITWVNVTFWSVVTAIGALAVYEVIFRRDSEEAPRRFFIVSVVVLVLSFIPIFIPQFSRGGTIVVLILMHISSWGTLLGVMHAYQDSRT